MGDPRDKDASGRPGGWGDQVPDQPKGTPDRTPGSREAFPRDVDQEVDRQQPQTDKSREASRARAVDGPDGPPRTP